VTAALRALAGRLARLKRRKVSAVLRFTYMSGHLPKFEAGLIDVTYASAVGKMAAAG
jgi:hypothetical protein